MTNAFDHCKEDGSRRKINERFMAASIVVMAAAVLMSFGLQEARVRMAASDEKTAYASDSVSEKQLIDAVASYARSDFASEGVRIEDVEWRVFETGGIVYVEGSASVQRRERRLKLVITYPLSSEDPIVIETPTKKYFLPHEDPSANHP